MSATKFIGISARCSPGAIIIITGRITSSLLPQCGVVAGACVYCVSKLVSTCSCALKLFVCVCVCVCVCSGVGTGGGGAGGPLIPQYFTRGAAAPPSPQKIREQYTSYRY